MQNDSLPDILLRELLSSPSGIKIQQIMETISTVQRRLVEIVENEDQRQLDLLRIGTVLMRHTCSAFPRTEKTIQLSLIRKRSSSAHS